MLITLIARMLPTNDGASLYRLIGAGRMDNLAKGG
jgi:hypothetical protein